LSREYTRYAPIGRHTQLFSPLTTTYLMDPRTLRKTIQKALSALTKRDYHDHMGYPAPNELAFKMMVIGVLTTMGCECTSEAPVYKRNRKRGYVDILVTDPDGAFWLLELKYYSLAYWNTQRVGYHDYNAALGEKQANMIQRDTHWDQLSKTDRHKQLFRVPGITENDVRELDNDQWKKSTTDNFSLAVTVLIDRAKQQVYDYTLESEVQRCVVIGIGKHCYVDLVNE